MNQPAAQNSTRIHPHSSSPRRGPQPHTTPLRMQIPQSYVPDYTDINDFAMYMARHELVTSGMVKFDDRPDNYWGWKSTFINAI